MKSASLGDIAKLAGVSRMTVSCALRNSPRVKPETRMAIQQIAERVGYVPDARMARLMTGVREAKSKEPLPIAWLNTAKYEDAWRKFPWLFPYYEGARNRCAELGYKLDEIWLSAPDMTARRISEILYHRGITGLIVCPSLESLTHLKLNWNRFASVTFEKAILAPRLHRVAHDYYYNMLLTLKMLRRSGYRRIGVFMQQLTERKSFHGYLAGLGYFQSGVRQSERVRPLLYRHVDEVAGGGRKFRAWLEKARPDVVVGHHSELVNWLNNAGRHVPGEIGVTHLALEDDCADWAGIWSRKREVGAQTVEQVVASLHNNQFGLPKVSHDLLIGGYWQPGKTLVTPKPRSV
jgi:LacI family transcriptional regulator